MPESSKINLIELQDRAREWMLGSLFPFWAEIGFDKRHNCFHEQIALTGEPVEMPRRIMVQARQVVCFALAGQLGWSGPWRELLRAGLKVLLEKGVRQDGSTRHQLTSDAKFGDDRRDLYDLAFVILALSEANKALDGVPGVIEAASDLLNWVEKYWRHPNGGFYEGEIVDSSVRRQNPHMHLLEALISLHETGAGDAAMRVATEIADLHIDIASRCPKFVIPEYYNHDNFPVFTDEAGGVEPGHQFEWSYLLIRFGEVANQDMSKYATDLRSFGEAYGVVTETGFIHESTDPHGKVVSATSRLWTHCERLKAAISSYEISNDECALKAIDQSFSQIQSYYVGPHLALAYERKTQNGEFLRQNSRASSLYHVVCALSELLRKPASR